jgi:cytochrome P450
MDLLKSRETTEIRSSPGSLPKDEKPKSPAGKPIPGPGRWETFRRLFPDPILVFPVFLRDMEQRFGQLVMFKLPRRTFVFVNDPDIVKEILVTQQHAFQKSEGGRALRYLLGTGLLTSEEPQHRERRRVVQPAFHHEKVAAFAQTMQRFADEWMQARRDGESVDMSAEMSELTLRIASVTLFGTDASADAATVRDALKATMETYPSAIGPLGRLRRSIPFWPSTVKFNKARATLDEVLYRLIAERRKEPNAVNDALSMLLSLDDEGVRDEAMTLFLAGHETTANGLFWTWYLLAKNPGVQQRFHAAVDANDDEYVRRVFKEAMRLYPPAWILGRETLSDVQLPGGQILPKKTTVFISPYILQRTPAYYQNPLAFDPDRWVNDTTPPYAYVPFGAGARRCIGEEFAWMEGVLLLKTIAKRWRFEVSNTVEPRIEAMVTLRPLDIIPMRVVAR